MVTDKEREREILTDTHTQRERERDRERPPVNDYQISLSNVFSGKQLHTQHHKIITHL